MTRVPLCLLGVAALCAWSVQAHAETNFSASQSAYNAAGEAVSARVDFKIQRDSILVYVKNTTSNVTAVDQAITSLSFSLPAHKARGGLDYARGTTREFAAAPATGVTTSSKPQDLRWTLQVSGNTFTLKAPGKRYGIMPESLTKGEGLLGDRAACSPFAVGTAVFLINMPELELTDMLDGVQFKWGPDVDEGRKISSATGAPDPSHMAGLAGPAGADAPGAGENAGDNNVLGNLGAWNYPAPVGDNPVELRTVGMGDDVSGGGGSSGGNAHPGSLPTGPGAPTDPTPSTTPTATPTDPTGPTPPLTPPTLNPPTPLLPIVGTPKAVPEPATCGLLLVGGLMLALRRKK